MVLAASLQHLNRFAEAKKAQYENSVFVIEELRRVFDNYDKHMAIREDHGRTYYCNVAVEHLRLNILKGITKDDAPENILKEIQEYRNVMCDILERNKQPLTEVRDKEYLPYMLRSVMRKKSGNLEN